MAKAAARSAEERSEKRRTSLTTQASTRRAKAPLIGWKKASAMDAPVVIAGGGPVGLSLGLGLSHCGVRSLILERDEFVTRESRALVIWPRTLELLQGWGAFEALCDAGTWRSAFEISAAGAGDRLVRVDFSNVADMLGPCGALLIPQSETERVLRRLVSESRHCELVAGCNVTAIEQDEHGVTVTAAGPDGKTESFQSRYAVGCDGAHSVVRHALGLTLEGVTYPARAMLSDEIVSGPAWTPPSPRFSLQHPAFALGIEYAPNHWRVVSLVPPDLDDESALSPQSHVARLARLLGEEVRAETVWRSLFRIHRRHAQRFVVGSVALAGDAAHLNSPAGGQGMNAGIQDAGNLAWKLAYALSGDADAVALLASYDIERREMITGGVERFTDVLTRFGMSGVKILGALPIRLLGRALREPGMQRKACRAIGMLGGRYTKSPLIDTRHPLAGRRVDDLMLSNGARINHERAGGAALVLVGTVDLPTLDAPIIRIAQAPKHWHLKSTAALVVRPDGCVAAVVEKPTPQRVITAWKKAFATPMSSA